MSRWFRYYDEALDDPKVQMLPPVLFKAWINLLCLSSRHGGSLPSLSAIAFALRLDDEETASNTLSALSERGLLDREGKTFHPHNWNGRQFKSDVSTDRVKQYRQRSKQQDGNVSSDVSETANETPPDTEQITDTEPPYSPPAKKERAQEFLQFKTVYPKRQGSQRWVVAETKFDAAVKAGADPEQIIAGARRYAAEQEKIGKSGTEFVMQAATWIGQQCWQEYAAPELGEDTVEVSKHDQRFAFLKARWDREGKRYFAEANVNKWPFPRAWLEDANTPRPKSSAELEAELVDPDFLLRRPLARTG